ncbi:hypothetical protein Tco_0285399 [Tanacetum coccineum]
MEMKLEEDEDESRSCADEEELDRKEMTKRGLNNGIFDDSLDDFSVRKPDMCTEVVPPVQFRISKHADRGANAILIVILDAKSKRTSWNPIWRSFGAAWFPPCPLPFPVLLCMRLRCNRSLLSVHLRPSILRK